MATWWSDTSITSQNEKFTLSEDMTELQALTGVGGGFKIHNKIQPAFGWLIKWKTLFPCVFVSG